MCLRALPAAASTDSQLRAARIAAMAAIIAALVSATSGIVTYVTTHDQIAAEDQRSATEFLRSQRQPIYAQFTADEQALRQAEQSYLHLVVGDSSDGAAPLVGPTRLNAF